MDKLIIKIPTLKDLAYRKKLLGDEQTMEYQTPIKFDEDKWTSWYDQWIASNNPHYFYGYLYDNNTKEPVGEISYHFNSEDSNCSFFLIIEYAKRNQGYGTEGLKKLIEKAFSYDFISEVLYDVNVDNIVAKHLLNKCGFNVKLENENYIRYCLKK